MIEQSSKQSTMFGQLGAFWGVAGVSLVLSFAVYRLMVITIDSFTFDFQWYHWLAFFANILFMAYSEGYKGFQKGFAPRVAARARYIKHNPRLLHVLVAPLFCMGYFFATRKRLIVTYTLSVGIIMLIIIFHQLIQPWRGILDAGVVVGLSWGIASLLWFSIEALGSGEYAFPAETPLAESNK
jgi:hypothetical protein